MELLDYWSKHWKSEPGILYSEKWQDDVKPGDKILDVGCGHNLWKDYPNLIGIDPYNPKAHQQVSIEEFKTDEKFDRIICFGSINFGTGYEVAQQMQKIYTLCKVGTKLYWRFNPGIRHSNPHAPSDLYWYDWDLHKIAFFSIEYGFHVDLITWECNNRRMYSEWTLL